MSTDYPALSGLQNIRIVLVETTHPGNMGAAARAMKNMGIGELFLVKPRLFPNEIAQSRAASAADVLEAATVVESVEEAIADCAWVVGTSARERTIPWPLMEPSAFAEQGACEIEQHKIAVVFGREDRGLTNDELKLCHAHLHIPTNPVYSSLNLAQAVQIVCYELRMKVLASMESTHSPSRELQKWDVPAANAEQMQLFYEHLEQTLGEIDFIKSNNPRQTMTRLQRLFNRARLDQMEVSILRGILKSIQKSQS